MPGRATAALSPLALLGALALLGGCATPTLPLPPPSALVSAPDSEGWVTVTGEVLEDAFVFVYNEDMAAGVIVQADATGAFAVQIQAAPYDSLTIWQRLGTDRGPDLHVQVPPPP